MRCIGAAMVAGMVLTTAAPAPAATPAQLEQRVIMMEQALQAMKAELAAAKATAQAAQGAVKAASAKPGRLPSWLERITPYGDIRLRFEHTSYDALGSHTKDSRDRFRVRLRFGLKSWITPGLELGFRVVSGADDDPTSTNQTMESWFQEHANFGFDRAWVAWTPQMVPGKMLWLTFGKVKNPFVTSKLIWDGDVNPSGGFIRLSPKMGGFTPFIMGGVMFLNEHSSSTNDVYAYGGQLGLKGKMGALKFTAAVGYIDWGDTGSVGNVPTHVHGNTEYQIPPATADGDPTIWLSDFRVVDFIAKASYAFAHKAQLSLWGHYLVNIGATGIYDSQNTGYGFGAGLKYHGASFKAWYKYVQANATPGFIADSDSGFVNRKGFVLQAGYKFTKRAQLKVSYFNTQPENENLPGARNASQTFFVDFVFKF